MVDFYQFPIFSCCRQASESASRSAAATQSSSFGTLVLSTDPLYDTFLDDEAGDGSRVPGASSSSDDERDGRGDATYTGQRTPAMALLAARKRKRPGGGTRGKPKHL